MSAKRTALRSAFQTQHAGLLVASLHHDLVSTRGLQDFRVHSF